MSVFKELESYRQRAIPDQRPVLEKKIGYRQYPLDVDDPRNNEPLVPISEFGIPGTNYYGSSLNPPYYERIGGSIDTVYVRRGVGQTLAGINERLAPVGLELYLFDGWRPTEVQSYFHNIWMPNELRRRNPDWDAGRIEAEVSEYWAAPTVDPRSPSPHATGGAVDLRLQWKSGEPLWFGSLFDDVSELAHVDFFEKKLAKPGRGLAFSDEEARANRRLLYWLMTEHGFAHNPTEWWHFGLGELMWAKLTGAPGAYYGLAEVGGN
ncbi:MAG: M15 family metallopeptidase [Hyphomonas sp.]